MDELRIYYSHNPITYTLNKLIAQQNPDSPSQQITARGIEAEGAISVLTMEYGTSRGPLHFWKRSCPSTPSTSNSFTCSCPTQAICWVSWSKSAAKFLATLTLKKVSTPATRSMDFKVNKRLIVKRSWNDLNKKIFWSHWAFRKKMFWTWMRSTTSFTTVNTPNTGGAYSLSSNAFKGFSNVQRFNIDAPKERKIHFPDTTLVALSPLFQLLRSHPAYFKEIEANLIHIIQKSKCAQRSKKLVIKVHPQDLLWIGASESFKSFIHSLRKLGKQFHEIEFPDEVDHNVELVFLGFQYYLVIGQSSASIYLEQYVSIHDFEIMDITN